MTTRIFRTPGGELRHLWRQFSRNVTAAIWLRVPGAERGFTLIELVLVIAILGILAVAVAPNFTNLLTNASTTGGRGTASKLQSAINMVYSERVTNNTTPFWPATLDGAANAACSLANPCFTTVVQPITSGGWTRTNATTYVFTNAGITQTYTYTPATGVFQCTAGNC